MIQEKVLDGHAALAMTKVETWPVAMTEIGTLHPLQQNWYPPERRQRRSEGSPRGCFEILHVVQDDGMDANDKWVKLISGVMKQGASMRQ